MSSQALRATSKRSRSDEDFDDELLSNSHDTTAADTTMESDDSLSRQASYRKRTLGDLHHPDVENAWNEEAAHDLEHSMKKVRISRQYPGQIRLHQDVNDCQRRLAALSVAQLRLDPRNPFQVSVILMGGREQYVITAGRYYPHHPPEVVRARDGERLQLPLLQNWLPVYTLGDILAQLVRFVAC